MVCNSLAVIQARISPDVAAEIMASDKAIEALRRYFAAQVGQPVAVYGSAANNRYHLSAGALGVYITGSGIEVIGTTLGNGRERLQQLTAGLEAQAQRMAVALATERTVGVLRSRYVVTGDQTLANGARVVRLSL